MYLAIDIGGTKVTVAPFEWTQGRFQRGDKARYKSRDYTSLEAILLDYTTRTGGRFRAVGIGAAGPVIGRRAEITNLPWHIDADAISAELRVPVALINDLAAHGQGIPLADPERIVTLNAGKPRPGNAALIAAGTGLGEAILFWDGTKHVTSSSEGGHATFGPRSEDELELLRFLMRRYDHVSWERVVSGLDGFRNLYDFLLETKRISVPADRLSALASGDIGEAITTAAVAGEAYAKEVVTWFARLYGAEAGNLALKSLAFGGVYISGGVAGRMMHWIEREFMGGFLAKGRFRELLKNMPVYVVQDEDLALKGAAVAARSLVG